ncbi:hypothetical protein ADL04_09685 [Streptomyces sp. NRRL B-3648]|nr:hypothetical protein ADL04_09685 [Streptomyces sp. NRRL B-3648]
MRITSDGYPSGLFQRGIEVPVCPSALRQMSPGRRERWSAWGSPRLGCRKATSERTVSWLRSWSFSTVRTFTMRAKTSALAFSLLLSASADGRRRLVSARPARSLRSLSRTWFRARTLA